MAILRIHPARVMAAVAIAAATICCIAPYANAAATNTSETASQEWARHRQEEIKIRVAKIANRLEIRSSQQNAWQAYANALTATMDSQFHKQQANMDAASIVRQRADAAAETARKLAQLADATARLQEVLAPDQRKTFDQIVQHAGHHRHFGFHHHDQEDHHFGEKPAIQQ
jgi:hypothetical protein